MLAKNSDAFQKLYDSLRYAYVLEEVPIEALWILDQLLGATFSLKLGQRIGAPGKANPELYRKDPYAIHNLRSPAYKHFAWGFYLNSAINRVVFAHERLDGLIKHLERSEINAHRVPSSRDTGRTYKKTTKYFDTVTEENILFILTERVNRQKHHISERAGHQISGIHVGDAALPPSYNIAL